MKWPMSGAGEDPAPGPQLGAEAGGGRLGDAAQGECRLQVASSFVIVAF